MLTIVPSLFKGSKIVPAGQEETPDFFIAYEHAGSKLDMGNLPPWKARFADSASAQHYAHFINQTQVSITVSVEQAASALDAMDDAARMETGIDAFGARNILAQFIAECALHQGAAVPESAQISRATTAMGWSGGGLLHAAEWSFPDAQSRQAAHAIFPPGWDSVGFNEDQPDRMIFLKNIRALGLTQGQCELVMLKFNDRIPPLHVSTTNARREVLKNIRANQAVLAFSSEAQK